MRSNSKQIGEIAVTALSDGVLAAPLDVVLGMAAPLPMRQLSMLPPK